LLIGGLFLGNYLCVQRNRLVTVEVQYLLGDPPVARRIDVEIVPKGGTEPVVTYYRDPAAPTTAHKPRMAPGLYTARITLTRADGTTHLVERTLDLRPDDSTVTIDVSGER